MKSTNLHLVTNRYIQIEYLGANWSRGNLVTQSFPSLAPGEVFNCRQTRFAALELAPGASDPEEGSTLKP